MSNVNYNKMSNKTPEPEKVVEPEKKDVIGVVSDCVKLNVRKQAVANSDVICVIDADTEVIVDEAKSTNDFYRVKSIPGVKPFFGYCMKKYITVKQ